MFERPKHFVPKIFQIYGQNTCKFAAIFKKNVETLLRLLINKQSLEDIFRRPVRIATIVTAPRPEPDRPRRLPFPNVGALSSSPEQDLADCVFHSGPISKKANLQPIPVEDVIDVFKLSNKGKIPAASRDLIMAACNNLDRDPFVDEDTNPWHVCQPMTTTLSTC